jgi:hypothetical protein
MRAARARAIRIWLSAIGNTVKTKMYYARRRLSELPQARGVASALS